MRSAFIALWLILAAPFGAMAAPTQFNLEYDASIQNVVSLGKVTLHGAIGPAGYNATATVRTSGFARLFDDTKISASAAGKVSAQGLAWTSYQLSHSYARKFRSVAMQRGADGIAAKIAPAYGDMGSPPASKAQQMAARDPVTTMAEMGRAIAVSRKCAGSFATFDGKQYYTLTLSPKASGTYEGGGYRGKALVCALRYQPIAGFKPMSAAERAKIPIAEIWFAMPGVNGFAAPLRIQAPTPFGAARLDLARKAGV